MLGKPFPSYMTCFKSQAQLSKTLAFCLGSHKRLRYNCPEFLRSAQKENIREAFSIEKRNEWVYMGYSGVNKFMFSKFPAHIYLF